MFTIHNSFLKRSASPLETFYGSVNEKKLKTMALEIVNCFLLLFSPSLYPGITSSAVAPYDVVSPVDFMMKIFVL